MTKMKIKDFKNNTQCKKYIKEVILKLELDTIIDENHKDFELLSDLIKHHHDSAKFKGETSHFIINRCHVIPTNKNVKYVSKCGFEIHFSASKCLDKKPDTKQILHKVFRYIILPQILDYKDRFFDQFDNSMNHYFSYSGISEMNNTNIIYKNDCHVDHYEHTFLSIVNTFIDYHRIDIETIEFIKKDNKWELKDKKLEKQFYDFHKKYAKLRVVSGKENLSQPKDGTIFKIQD